MVSTTRGRSFTDFPRNTAAAHRASCARLVQEQLRRREQEEFVYAEYAPAQVYHAEEMTGGTVKMRRGR